VFWILKYLRTAGDNFHAVVPGRLYRSATPTPSRLRRWRKQYGIQTWLDLRLPSDSTYRDPEWFPAQCAAARDVGITRISLPMSDRTPTSEEQARLILDVLTDRPKHPILVACQGGRHRAGQAVALYRVRVQGWPPQRAIAEAERHGYYDHGHREFGAGLRRLLGL